MGLRVVIAAAALGAPGLVWLAADERAPAASPTPAPAPALAPPQQGRAFAYRGMAIQVRDAWLPRYLKLVDEVADLGANTVLLSPAGYMEHARSQAIFIDARRVPSPVEFKALIEHARQRGLQTIVMPIVLLRHPHGSEWRGVIDPPNWDEWWRQYRDVVKYFADIAREGAADVLMVGSELVSTEKYTSEWIKTIDTARSLYAGKLGYSANWDHFRPVQFWDKLDVVAMTSYYTLAERDSPTVDEIIEHWRPIQKDLLSFQQMVGKPLLLTEVGWCSQEGAARAPWNYFQNERATPAGLEEQRRLYEAFLHVWDGVPGLAGAIWWEWTDSTGGPGDHSYSPRGKPAEQVLRRWFAESRQRAAQGAGPAATP